jgi:hypothetical protein
VALDGWTKVGDQIDGTGLWAIYRHKGVLLASLELIEQFPADEPERASRSYAKRVETVRRGGIWLVAPNGRVCGATFIRL